MRSKEVSEVMFKSFLWFTNFTKTDYGRPKFLFISRLWSLAWAVTRDGPYYSFYKMLGRFKILGCAPLFWCKYTFWVNPYELWSQWRDLLPFPEGGRCGAELPKTDSRRTQKRPKFSFVRAVVMDKNRQCQCGESWAPTNQRRLF